MTSLLILSRAPLRQPLTVTRMLRPAKFGDRTWQMSLSRLEELGIFQGQVVEKAGSPGRVGAVILKAGGSRVALSKELAEAVLVRISDLSVRSGFR